MNNRVARLAEAYVEHSRDWERRETLRLIREETRAALRVLDDRIERHSRKIRWLESVLTIPKIRDAA